MEWLIELAKNGLKVLLSSLLIIGVGFLGTWFMSNLPDGRHKEL